MDDMRKCIGSAKFGIEAHEAPVADFPAQPSQRDGLGRMCKTHWTEYTRALRKAAVARQAAETAGKDSAATQPSVTFDRPAPTMRNRRKASKPEPIRTKPARGRKTDSEVKEASTT